MKNLSGAAKTSAAKIFRKTAAWAILAGCGFALVRCEDRVAGSSVTTGNPTEIQVSFTGENGPVAVSGRMELYGATQIPVPGFDPTPLAKFELQNAQEFRLKRSHLDAIPDSAWPEGSRVGDTLVKFNLVVSGNAEGSILGGLAFRSKSGQFALKDGVWKLGKEYGLAQIEAGLVPFTTYRAFIDPKSLTPNRHQFLFLAGTGYVAKSDSGNFHFPILPSGTHKISFVSVPDKENIMFPEDSVNIYGVDKPLLAGQVDTLVTQEIQTRLPMPDEYKKP